MWSNPMHPIIRNKLAVTPLKFTYLYYFRPFTKQRSLQKRRESKLPRGEAPEDVEWLHRAPRRSSAWPMPGNPSTSATNSSPWKVPGSLASWAPLPKQFWRPAGIGAVMAPWHHQLFRFILGFYFILHSLLFKYFFIDGSSLGIIMFGLMILPN